MRRGYKLNEKDMEALIPFFKGAIMALEEKQVDSVDLDVFNIGPAQCLSILATLGWEREEWDANGWEQDTWYYLYKENNSSLTLFYCGYTGEIRLYLEEEVL